MAAASVAPAGAPGGGAGAAQRRSLLVVGATGVVGAGVLHRILERAGADRWHRVYCLCRSPKGLPDDPRVVPVRADALRARELRVALETVGAEIYGVVNCAAIGLNRASPFETKDIIALRKQAESSRGLVRGLDRVPGVRNTVWTRIADECGLTADVNRRNLRIVRHLLHACVRACPRLRHFVQVTGAKGSGMHLGPMWRHYEAPLVEEPTHRPPGPNWYFPAEEMVRSVCEAHGWGWTVLRPAFVISKQPAGLNLAAGIACVADHCQKHGHRALRFPGGTGAWTSVHSLSSTDTIADMACWRCTQAARAAGAIMNCTTCEFTWAEVWPGIAAYFGMGSEGPSDRIGEPCVRFDETAGGRAVSAVKRWFVDACLTVSYDSWLCPQRCAALGWKASEQSGTEALLGCFEQYRRMGVILLGARFLQKVVSTQTDTEGSDSSVGPTHGSDSEADTDRERAVRTPTGALNPPPPAAAAPPAAGPSGWGGGLRP